MIEALATGFGSFVGGFIGGMIVFMWGYKAGKKRIRTRILSLPHEDYCCTKGCPGYGLAACGKVYKPGEFCDGSECSCSMAGPIRATKEDF